MAGPGAGEVEKMRLEYKYIGQLDKKFRTIVG